MTQATVSVGASRAAVNRALATVIPTVTSGNEARAVLLRAGVALLGRIRRAFVAKSRGGTDEAGDRWAPLSPKTVAYGRRAGRTRSQRGRPDRPSQALTARQQSRWWELYRQGLAMYGGDRGKAARRAWGIMRRAGATTLLDRYGGARAEILRDTGQLLASLSPTGPSDEQVLRAEGATISVGTNREGALAHHQGVPGRLPQRRLWPEVSKWPASWWRDILEQVRAGVLAVATSAVRAAR